MPPRIVLDTCVLFPFALRDVLLRCGELGLFHPVWSAAILSELRRVLLRNSVCSSRQAGRLIAAMKAAFPDAAIPVPERLIAAMRNNVGDRHIAAAAVASRAIAICTVNVRHFRPPPEGIAALTPDRFLLLLRESAPDAVDRAVESARAALRNPPVAADEYLRGLSRIVPTFVRALRG